MKKSTELVLRLWKSYIILVFSFGIILIAITIYMNKRVNSYTIAQNQSISIQAMNNIEDEILAIRKFVNQISSNPDLYSFATVEKENLNQYQNKLYHLRNECNKFGNFIDCGQYFICFDRNDVCFNSFFVCTDIDKYYKSVFQFGLMEKEEYFNYKRKLESEIFLPCQNIRLGAIDYKGMIYHIKLYSYSNNSISIFLFMEDAYLKKLLTPLDSSKIFILNPKNEVIYTYNTDLDEIKGYLSEDGIDISILKSKYIITELSSSYGLQYFCMTPKVIALKEVHRMLWITAVIIISLIIIALFISFSSSYYNSRFIRNILLDSTNLNEKEKVNIYKEMNALFDRLKEDNLLLQEKMNLTQKKLYQNFFSNLLSGKFEQLYDIQVYIRDLGIILDDEKYNIILFSCDCAMGIIKYSNIEELKKCHDYCCGILTEYIENGYVIPLDMGRIAIILENQRNIQETAQGILNKIEDNLDYDKIAIRICLTEKFLVVTQIQEIVKQCNVMLDLESFQKNTERQILILHKKEREINLSYILPDEKITLLFAAIQNGDFLVADEIFTYLFHEVLKYSQDNLSLKIEFLSRIRQTILLSNKDSTSYIQQSINLFTNIRMGNTLYLFLIGIIEEICNYNQRQNETQEDEYKKEFLKKVKQYIDNDLQNPELSLNYLANKFGFAPTYFSVVFKEQMNITLSAYLDTKRMHKAHELILSSDCRLEEVAKLCGYINSNTFRRTYRRIYGINPSAMRKIKEERL